MSSTVTTTTGRLPCLPDASKTDVLECEWEREGADPGRGQEVVSGLLPLGPPVLVAEAWVDEDLPREGPTRWRDANLDYRGLAAQGRGGGGQASRAARSRLHLAPCVVVGWVEGTTSVPNVCVVMCAETSVHAKKNPNRAQVREEFATLHRRFTLPNTLSERRCSAP